MGRPRETLPFVQTAQPDVPALTWTSTLTSYKCALKFLAYPHVSKGGIVAFDEYGSATWIGARRRPDFLLMRPERVVKSPVVDLYYVVKEGD